MRHLIGIILLVVLSGCGKGKVDDAFAPYVARFEGEAAIRGVQVSIIKDIFFAKLPTGTLGVCRRGSLTGHIEIDPDAWAIADDMRRELLIFHELGHCVLGRSHKDDVEEGKPVSVMHHELLLDYLGKRAALVDELFDHF